MKIVTLDYEQGNVKVIENTQNKYIVNFLRELLQSYVDSYLMVAHTISSLQEEGTIIE